MNKAPLSENTKTRVPPYRCRSGKDLLRAEALKARLELRVPVSSPSILLHYNGTYDIRLTR